MLNSVIIDLSNCKTSQLPNVGLSPQVYKLTYSI